MSTTRPDRRAVVALLAPWADAMRHDCLATESMIDALLDASRDQAAQLARQDAELVHLRALTVHQARTIVRQRKEIARLRQALAAVPADPPTRAEVALAWLASVAEALGAAIDRAWHHERWT